MLLKTFQIIGKKLWPIHIWYGELSNKLLVYFIFPNVSMIIELCETLDKNLFIYFLKLWVTIILVAGK